MASTETATAVSDAVPVSSGGPTHLRAWLYLVLLSWQRQARLRQMVWIALAVLLGSVLLVGVRTARRGWNMDTWRSVRLQRATYAEIFDNAQAMTEVAGAVGAPGSAALPRAVTGAYRTLLDNTGVMVFSIWVVFSVFVSFLLPLLSLAFGTEALGGDRESQSLLWLLTRPLPRPAIYLAKFVALLPWTLAMNVGGFALLCVAGGRAGLQALALYWPAVVCATVAFASLFLLLGAVVKRPVIWGLVYCFFLETILGNMPGYLKRVSISFYTRSMMYEAARDFGVQPEKPTVFLPVDGLTALLVLLGVTVVLLGVGMVLFSRREYVSVE